MICPSWRDPGYGRAVADASGPRALWEIQVGVYATKADARRLADEFTALLRPDPDHAPPCPVPWAVAVVEGDEDLHGHLREQANIEGLA